MSWYGWVCQCNQCLEIMTDWIFPNALQLTELVTFKNHKWLVKQYFEESGSMGDFFSEVHMRIIAQSFEVLDAYEIQ